MQNDTKKRLPGSLRILCETAPDFGVEAEQCLEGTGVVVFDLYDNTKTITLAQELAAIENFLRFAGDHSDLGIQVGRRYRPQVFGIWGYAILSSPTFRASLKVATEYANLSFLIAALTVNETHDPPLLSFDAIALPPHIRSFVLQRHLTVVSNFSSVLLPDFKLSNFVFETTLEDPKVAEAIEAGLGMTVRLKSEHDAVLMSNTFLDMPLPKHDPDVMENCLKQCRDLLKNSKVADQNWSAKVRDVALLDLRNDPSIGATAQKLGVSERTLRRRLSEEGTSFRSILVEARLVIGHELLREAKLDVSTVAYRTGYSEPSSFVRAFTQHFGYSPGKVKFAARDPIQQIQ
ncbi:MAG: AraC family transcriptional regulator [Pelagimonas sp.]|jgi:AraC-like DNA-binding protein|nr:AraC family transcriptional regulator [Pelagimonas sp.]